MLLHHKGILMSVRKFVLPVFAAGVGIAVVVAGVAFAHDDPQGVQPDQGHAGHHAAAGGAAVTATGYQTSSKAAAVYFAAGLSGRNEVPAGAGDPDGRAMAVVRVKGDQVSYAVRWQNITAPKAFHIHQGVAGANGGVKVDFLGSDIPAGVQAITGSVKVTDSALLESIRTNPAGFYLNLHTAEFPAGAVRGQLHTLKRAVDLNGVLNGSIADNLQSVADGKQEVPGPKPVGDPDGRAAWLMQAAGDKVSFATVWSGIGAPTNGHIHSGARGVNGPVVADFFADADGLPASVTGVAGTATVGADLAGQIAKDPAAFYTNLHTAEFAGGAVRGQLAKNKSGQPRAVQAAVVGGSQIYRCAAQPGGGFAFGQFGVAAVLRDGILHSFAKPVDGPPQWIAPDGTAVTATLVTKSANGDGNIPELLLDARQVGGRSGILADTTQILRLNTVGGVAPAGSCDLETQAVVSVPYQADYLFLG
ncbi:CHRD domain-containing protein [Kribbella albertanoniae]|uniref:CHRD domain-containing protein n=2 Tax=Kribbella albertanoniae TaxID=1266829 RepID=A0A4R4Q0U7_9ACTN|nr:CHRD domain-containing protein [Kribbella albertanoniae]